MMEQNQQHTFLCGSVQTFYYFWGSEQLDRFLFCCCRSQAILGMSLAFSMPSRIFVLDKCEAFARPCMLGIVAEIEKC
jgi:hypothetical protein